MRGHSKPATLEDFSPAKLKIGERVHVLGWAKAAVFTIIHLDHLGVATIETRKTGKRFFVAETRLLALKGCD